MALDISSWEQIFQELIQQEEPWARWTLKLDETLQPDSVAQGWKQYQQRAFGRFQCSSCQRRWASAKVQVLCHMHWEHWMSQGQVLMRIFAQRCKKCYQSQFEKPEFSSESTRMILNNLVQRILERFYREGIRMVPEIPVATEVPLKGSHDTDNCEACILGFCKQGSQSFVTEPPKSPLFTGSFLPPPIGDLFVQNQARNNSTGARAHMGSEFSHAIAGTQISEPSPQPETYESLTTESRRLPLTWERQVRSSPRRSSPDSTFKSSLTPPPKDCSGQNRWFTWGCICVVLSAFIITR